MDVSTQPWSSLKLLALLGVIALADSAAEAGSTTPGERSLEGEWIIVKMLRQGKPVELPQQVVDMRMAFRLSDHSWSFTMRTKSDSFSEGGTWQLDGSMLVTRSADGSKVERMRVRHAGPDAIELKKTAERLVLRRVP